MSNNKQVATRQEQRDKIATVQSVLEKMKPQLSMALPAHIKAERMIRVALTAIQNTPKLLECDRNSFMLAVLRAAQLGLEPDGVLGQAYLIPYGGQVQLIPGYKGLIDLARRSGEVSNIIAQEVCKNDEFTVDWSGEVPFHHKPKMDGDRGEVTHFWALARFKDGGFHWDYMSIADVLAIRDNSSGWKMALKYAKRDKEGNIKEINSPWHNHFSEMGKKTVIRRICKYLPMSVQKAAMVEDLVDAGKQFTIDQAGGIILENDNDSVVGSSEGESQKLDNFVGGQKEEDTQETAHDAQTGEVIEPMPLLEIPLRSGKKDFRAFSALLLETAQRCTIPDEIAELQEKNKSLINEFKESSPSIYKEFEGKFVEMQNAVYQKHQQQEAGVAAA